jgi:hypothetical protein
MPAFSPTKFLHRLRDAETLNSFLETGGPRMRHPGRPSSITFEQADATPPAFSNA